MQQYLYETSKSMRFLPSNENHYLTLSVNDFNDVEQAMNSLPILPQLVKSFGFNNIIEFS